ncbi:hypothetical protein U9M48_030828 [Paspalum notatum var. saurae]|uniref:Uncharacterized protein n=1 Tax=Paspalum notatum var. saurae TaxID=547442 RepID=A0AAQ3U4E7_PASNO
MLYQIPSSPAPPASAAIAVVPPTRPAPPPTRATTSRFVSACPRHLHVPSSRRLPAPHRHGLLPPPRLQAPSSPMCPLFIPNSRHHRRCAPTPPRAAVPQIHPSWTHTCSTQTGLPPPPTTCASSASRPLRTLPSSLPTTPAPSAATAPSGWRPSRCAPSSSLAKTMRHPGPPVSRVRPTAASDAEEPPLSSFSRTGPNP